MQVFKGKIGKPHKETAYREYINYRNFRTLAYSSNTLGTLAKPHFRQYGTNYISAIALRINTQKCVAAINFLKRTSVFICRQQSRLVTV